jgi:hypothetical protein
MNLPTILPRLGSFCAAPYGGDRTSTIGQEKAANPLTRRDDEDAFVARSSPARAATRRTSRARPRSTGRAGATLALPDWRRWPPPACRS